MTGLTLKDRAALSFLYERDEFKAFKKLCALKRQKVADMLIQQDMSSPGADKAVALLQGQAYTLEYLLKEMQQIHRREVDGAVREQTKKH